MLVFNGGGSVVLLLLMLLVVLLFLIILVLLLLLEGVIDFDLIVGEIVLLLLLLELVLVVLFSDLVVLDVFVVGGVLFCIGVLLMLGVWLVEGVVVLLYCVEIVVYVVVLLLLCEILLVSFGIFYEWQGEQCLLYNQGIFCIVWGCLVGQSSEIYWKGDVQLGFDGDVMGLQVGIDVWVVVFDSYCNQIGVFVGCICVQGKIIGLVLGWENVQVGQNCLDDKYVGLYWIFIDSSGVYIDVVVMQSCYDGCVCFLCGFGFGLSGDGISVLVEVGKLLLYVGQFVWWLELQLQVIWQCIVLDDCCDEVLSVCFDNDNDWIGCIGLCLVGDYQLVDNGWQLYFKFNYWYGCFGEDCICFDGDVIVNLQCLCVLEVGVGVVGCFNCIISVYVVVDYMWELGGDCNEKCCVIEGNIGLCVDWQCVVQRL